ncbi:MAG: LysM peptidoglycan-binding domain-containing protein [Treponema sp.]|nr:LysM peptidoglycan-binding domain-containing protein [Treponema sp.]
MLFKRNRIPFTIPYDARELTEDEMILVNGGAEEKKESQESKSESVTVKSGNTLSGIVSDYNKANGTNYTVSDVAKNSGISNPDVIYPGQEIKFGASNSTGSGCSLQGNDQTSVQTGGSQKNISNSQSNTNAILTATEKGERNCACSTERCKINYGAGDMTVTERIASEKKKNAGGKIEGNAYKPNEIDSDVRYNAKDYKGEHIMTLKYDDKENYAEFRDYYLTVGQYGTAETISYDGIGLTDEKGNILHILRDEKSILKYSKSLGLPTGPSGDVFLTLELDLVGGIGFEASVSLVVDLDNWKDSGINFSAGPATGLNVGVGAGVGYVKRELEGSTPIAVDGNFGGALSFSPAIMTDDQGFNGVSVSLGPGMGLSTSTQKSYTLSINNAINFFKGVGN